MPDNNAPTGGDPQAGDPAEPQAAPPTPEPQAGDGQPALPTATISAEEAHKLRSEAYNLRQREKKALADLKVYQDKEQAAKDAELSEVERVTRQHGEVQAELYRVQAELQEERVFNAVLLHAGKLNFVLSPERLLQLIPGSDIEYDEGRPTNIEALLVALAKAEPRLVEDRATQAPAANGTMQPAQPVPGQAPARQMPPTIPAFAGRSSIPAPGQQPTPGRPPSLSEAHRLQRELGQQR